MTFSVDRVLSKARTAEKKGDIEQAEHLYNEVVAEFPNNARARNALNKLKSRGSNVLGSAASVPQNQLKKLDTLYRQGRFIELVELGEVFTKSHPKQFDLYAILGAANSHLKQFDRAISCFKKALQIKPENAGVHYNLGVTLKNLGRREEAIACYTRALQIKPDFAEAHYNLGNAFQDLGRREEAITCYTRALKINPNHAKAHVNLGTTLKYLGRGEEAIACYTRALKIKPDNDMAHFNLGDTLSQFGRGEEAVACHTRALKINPDNAEAHAAKLHAQAHICDWDGINAEAKAISTLGISGDPVRPFKMLAREDNPARHRVRSERYSSKQYPRQELPPFSRPGVKTDRLRIGYFSADFRLHPLMHLLAKLFEVHDRNRFAVHAYSFGPYSNDDMRTRAQNAFDKFHDVRSLSDKDAANLARKESIDIAIDLTGHTAQSRLGIFTYGAAPIQVNYLGYPGTLGAPFIDYIVADHTLIPQDMRDCYSEKVIYLPHTYQVNDNTREISGLPMTRTEMGLPDRGFVFCCFNNNYKITPEEFDIWMRLLANVEGSVLWLMKSNEWAEVNLRKEAQKRNIDRDRLIFAEKLPLPEHLARHRLADLFLDTFNYNAHTTASDALWAGLPVITKLGRGFAARVAGSLLNAIDLPELITHTHEEYERLALELATNPEKLRGIKMKLEKNRNTKPLFDTELFAKHIENAYEQAYQQYVEGKDPDAIVVEG